MSLRGLASTILTIILTLAAFQARAAELSAFLKIQPIQSVFPSADHVGKIGGTPPSAPIFRNNKLVGYAFLTSDVIASAGYSGKPIKIMAAIDLDGILTGARVVEHHEPILVLGIKDERLDDFTAQFTGMDIRKRVRLDRVKKKGEAKIDMVSGATITSLVFSDSIMRSARLVARSRGIISRGLSSGKRGAVDIETFSKSSWRDMIADGSIRRLHLTNAEVDTAFKGSLTRNGGGRRKPDQTFINLYTALVTPAAIGQNLLGFTAYNKLMSERPEGADIIFVAGDGFYSFRGYSYRQTGYFERLQLVQGGHTIRLTKAMHQRVESLKLSDAPELRDLSLFVLPPDSGFKAAEPWRLEILVERKGEYKDPIFAGFPLIYELPSRYLIGGVAENETKDAEMTLWERRWREDVPHIVILLGALGALLTLLVFQDWVSARTKLLKKLRVAFLFFTLIYLGWTVAAQLSVINVLTFVNSLLTGFRWDFFLLEPLIFILWGFVAVSMLFWGRGVFCGWLCPFGALQELISRFSRKAGLVQLNIPFVIHERLWPIKYIIFLALFALSLGPADLATKLAEVEPFKTTITLKFIRALPFVFYAVALLIGSAFIQRLFCRYLCPLGAALAIPGDNRMFVWLKRRRQCGIECNICATKCPVQAIHPEGRINPHECIYCLNCQSLYYNDTKCPPLIDRRKRREQRQKLRERRSRERIEEKKKTGGETP